MDQQVASRSPGEKGKMTCLSQLSQLLDEESVTYESEDHIALQRQGCKVASLVWRERVTQWCYDVVDHLHESRSIVYVAMNILDRYFVQGCAVSSSDRSFEAAALTALFLAVRIRGTHPLEVVDLVRMSRLGVSVREIVNVGKEMTHKLFFDRRLLTPSDFIQHLLSQLPPSFDAAQLNEISDSAGFYTEVCVVDSYFVGVKASDIALASVLNAIDTDVSSIVDIVNSAPGARFCKEKLRVLRKRLNNLCNETSNLNSPHVISDTDDEPSDVIPFPDGHVRIVSQEKICLKRSVSSRTLSAMNHKKSSDTMVSPNLVSEVEPRKKRRCTLID